MEGASWCSAILAVFVLILVVMSLMPSVNVLQSNKVDQSRKSYGCFSGCLLLIILVAGVMLAGFWGFTKKNKSALGGDFINIFAGTQKSDSHAFVYDTDNNYNDFIKSGLSVEQMKVLDKLLDLELDLGEMRLGSEYLNAIAQQDEKVKEAYKRWRQCYELMRSSTHVVYPSERGKHRF